MLAVSEHNISHIANAKSVYQDRPCLNVSCDLGAVLIHFQNISRCKNKNVFFWDSKLLGNMFLSSQMTVFSMNRNRVFRTDQGIDQFNLFLAGMSRYMSILENNFCALHIQLVDHFGNCFFISRNRI